MPTTAVLGGQWGDEGKGKVVDRLAAEVDLVVRFQGGANAGHTVRIGDDTFVLHLLPTGILRENVQCLLGPGVVVDPWTLGKELDDLSSRGIDTASRLHIAGSAHVVMPYHKRLEELREEALKKKSIGTTLRGIGPTYEDKMARLGIRVADLMRKDEVLRRLVIEKVLRANRLLAERHEAPAMASEAIADEVIEHATRLRPMVVNAFDYLRPVRERRWSALLEGAQGALLDIDHGTFPYVTSSSCTVGGVFTGSGLSHRNLDEALGVYKAYCTRVGNGPFPCELHGEAADSLRNRGAEFGATTGRPRRCGWFDAVAARYVAEINGLDGVALTKLDVLTGIDPIPVAVAYELDGERRETFTNWADQLDRCKPIYQEFAGWTEPIEGATSFEDLPAAARDYVLALEKLIGVPIRMISTGAGRDAWAER
jgi:adenylosuccinate synthase